MAVNGGSVDVDVPGSAPMTLSPVRWQFFVEEVQFWVFLWDKFAEVAGEILEGDFIFVWHFLCYFSIDIDKADDQEEGLIAGV